MTKRSTFSSTLLGKLIILSLLSLAWSTIGQAQQPSASDDRSRGIELLQKDDAVGASKLLRAATKRDKNDLAAWHWLGLALERQGKPGDARKAHERAARLGEVLLMNQLDASGSVAFDGVIANLKPQLDLASESANAYLRLSPKLSTSKSEEWSERCDFLRDYAEYTQVGGFPIYTGKEVTTKVRVLAKPEPTYTEDARKHQVTGTVILKAIFEGDGKVRGIVPVSPLPHGLTAMAIRAARQIRFTPATKDGRPVSMWLELQYNFNLY